MKTTENFQPMGSPRKASRKPSSLNGHSLPLCETGKLRYRSREQATDALRRAKWSAQRAESFGEESRRREVRAYFCEDACRGWHLTSKAEWIPAGAR
jgi:hypothetical protein